MAQHGLCESNQANWLGVRPGIVGEDILISALSENATLTIYTVPANKKFYLFAWSTNLLNNTGATNKGYLFLRDSTSAVRAYFMRLQNLDDVSSFSHQEFYMPIECYAGDYFQAQSPVTNLHVYVTIHGILVDV